MKFFFRYLFFLSLLSCQKTDYDLIKGDYLIILQNYYFSYPPIKTIDHLDNFINYCDVHYSDIENVNTLNKTIKYLDDKLLISINIFETIEIDLKNEVGIPDWCQNDVSIKGFFSNKLVEVDSSLILKEINEVINIEFNNQVGIPYYNEELRFNNNPKVVFVYDGVLNEVCVFGELPVDMLKEIKIKLNEIIKNKNEFDYALIPLELTSPRSR